MNFKTIGITFGAIVLLAGTFIVSNNFAQLDTGISVGLVNVEAEEFSSSISTNENVILIDVRTPEEYTAGHIEGALNIDFYEESFPYEIATLDKNASYAIYCRSGNRTSHTLELMKQLGFTNVINLSGGILTWGERPLVSCDIGTC